jgi:DNA-binding MarR family transcriptional regulator/DNA-directed RNA polymerase subunit RPC12/RpoP
MFCSNCGVEVEETDKFCYNCGHKLKVRGRVSKSAGGEVEKQVSKAKSAKSPARGKAKSKIKLKCSIQGMNKKFKPNGSYRLYSLGRVSLEEALEYLRMMPEKEDFPPKLLKRIKNMEDVCVPHLIFSNTYTLTFFTSDGESIEVITEDFTELAGFKFKSSSAELIAVDVSREEAEEILKDFFWRVERIKELKLRLSPLQLSIMTAIDNGVSNSHAMAAVTGVGQSEVKDEIKELLDKDYIKLRKKGFIRKKYWYELTPKGESILARDRRKVEKAVADDDKMLNNFAALFWMMYALHVVPDTITGDQIVDVIGEPPGEVEEVVAVPEDMAYDIDVDAGGDGDDGGDYGDDGDWGDGGDDGGW